MTDDAQSPFAESVSIDATFDPATAETIVRSLQVESEDLVDDRSATRIEWQGERVRIVVKAADLTALRAATNTWLGLLGTTEETAALVHDRV